MSWRRVVADLVGMTWELAAVCLYLGALFAVCLLFARG